MNARLSHVVKNWLASILCSHWLPYRQDGTIDDETVLTAPSRLDGTVVSSSVFMFMFINDLDSNLLQLMSFKTHLWIVLYQFKLFQHVIFHCCVILQYTTKYFVNSRHLFACFISTPVYTPNSTTLQMKFPYGGFSPRPVVTTGLGFSLGWLCSIGIS